MIQRSKHSEARFRETTFLYSPSTAIRSLSSCCSRLCRSSSSSSLALYRKKEDKQRLFTAQQQLLHQCMSKYIRLFNAKLNKQILVLKKQRIIKETSKQLMRKQDHLLMFQNEIKLFLWIDWKCDCILYYTEKWSWPHKGESILKMQ